MMKCDLNIAPVWNINGKIKIIGSSTLQGFSYVIKTNDSGSSLVDYVILDTDGLSWELKPSYRCTINAMKCSFFHSYSKSLYQLTGLTWRAVLCISWVGIFTFPVDLDPEETPPAGLRLASSAREVRGTQRYTPNLRYMINPWLKFSLLKLKKYIVFNTRGGSVLDHHHLLHSTHHHGLCFGSDLLCQVQWPQVFSFS